MSSPCRVLVLNERDPQHPKAGGAEIHVAEIFRRLAAQEYEITLAASGFRDGAAVDEIDGMRVWRLGGIPTYYPRVAYTTFPLYRCLRSVITCLVKLHFNKFRGRSLRRYGRPNS